MSWIEAPWYFADQRADLFLEGLDVEVAAIDRAGHHQRDVGEEADVVLPERHQQQHHRLAQLRADLAGHPEVEEVELVLLGLPHQVAGVRVGVEEPVDHDLLVEGLEQLPRGLVAGSAPPARSRSGRRRRRCITSSRDGREVACRRRARPGGRTARSPRASARCCAPRCRKSSSRCSDVDRCSKTARMSITCLSPGRSPAFSANTSRSARSCSISSRASGRCTLITAFVAVGQHRAVHLRDRAGGERLGLDVVEHVLPRHAQLLLHHLRRPAPRTAAARGPGAARARR